MLSSAPTSNVTVNIVRSDGTEIRLSKTELTFTPSNWNIIQTVTLTAEDDEDITDDEETLIFIARGDDYEENAISVHPEAVTIDSLGQSVQLSAIIQDQDGSSVTGVSFNWSSADPSVAVVDSTGKVTAVDLGMTAITATLDVIPETATISGEATVQVASDGITDRDVLVALYHATDGPNWFDNTNWLTDAPLGEWYGVSTDNAGRVVSLDLRRSNLTGSIPPELGKLANLSYLNLSENELSGSIPPELGNLANLSSFSVYSNELSGPIPPELGDLANLSSLLLTGNELSGPIPPELGNLANLSSLDLGRNALSGPIPPELGNLANLGDLYLGGNDLTGPIPPELGSLFNLVGLGLSDNELSGPIPPELGNLANLSSLYLSWNDLTGSIPPELGSLANLSSLYLSWNDLTGSIPPELGSLANLSSLGLHINNLSGPIPPELGKLANLSFLSLWGNDLIGPIPPELGNLDNLTQLSLSGNNLTGPIPPELGSLANLLSLDLRFNDLTGSIPPELGNLENLSSLILWSNDLTGSIPPELGNLANLDWLSLSFNKLSGTIPLSFQQLSKLRGLRFSYNIDLCLPDNLVTWYETLEQQDGPICPDREVLQALYEAAGGDGWTNATGWLTDVPLGEWYGIKMDTSGRVSTVDLAGNGLSGHLTDRIGELAGLTVLRIGDNALTGYLPPSLRLLPLQELHYANTGLCIPTTASFQIWLTGIPSHEGTAKECQLEDREILQIVYQATKGLDWTVSDNWLTDAPLEQWHGVKTNIDGRVVSLELRENELDGEIPPELGELAELNILILSNNLLRGSVPADLGNLENLQFLNLAANQLSGPIPPELGKLSSLEYLDLNYNQLTSIPPELGQLENLWSLRLSENQLTSIPPELGQLENLWELDLSENQLTSIPPELGQLENLGWLSLSGNRLTSIPSELGQLENLRTLYLFENRLTSIPSELGQLENLGWLSLYGNQLPSIPSELGQLENLRYLYLNGNHLPSIPPELGQLENLRSLYLSGNQLNAFPHSPEGFRSLRVLDLSQNEFTLFPSGLGELDFLQILELGKNRLTDIPSDLGHIADMRQTSSAPRDSIPLWGNRNDEKPPWELDSDEHRFPSDSRELDRFNDLQAKIDGLREPRIIVNDTIAFPNLEILNLSSNELSGPFPEGLVHLTELGSLSLNHNTGLAGPLPLGLTALELLEELHINETSLCTPAIPEFLDWLSNVTRQRVTRCEQGEKAMAYLVQAVQSREFPVPLVAGESALLRVFLTVKSGNANMPPVRATFYWGEAVIHRVEIPGTSHPIPAQVDESSLLKSANAEIPGHVIQPGLEVVIEPDPERTLDPALGVVPRIPATGRMAVDVRTMPVFEVTLVPFLWQKNPDSSIIDTVAAMAADPQGHRLFERTHLLLPISEINATAHEPVLTSTNNGGDLLDEVNMIRIAEGRDGHYLAVMAPPTTGRYAGVAHIGGWSSFSVLSSDIIAHEFGHNRSLDHAPCGGAGSPDRFYPYEEGNIGAWGYNFDTAELISPRLADFMSYCRPDWTSDYHFTNAVRYRLETETEPNSNLIAAASSAWTASERTLMLWGGLNEEGEPYLRPSFFIDTSPVLPEAGGPWSLTGVDETGAVLFSLSFAMSEFTDTDDERAGFTFAVPVTWTEELSRITLQGPGGLVNLDRNTDQPMTILRDATTGRIRGILDGVLGRSALDMIAISDENTQNIQVLISRGIPDSTDVQR